MLSGELQALVDQGVISMAQAVEAAKAAPAPGEFTGFARCMTPGCEEHGADRPIRLLRTTKQVMADGLPVVEAQNDYHEVVDELDTICPECREPCAILETQPPTYARMM